MMRRKLLFGSASFSWNGNKINDIPLRCGGLNYKVPVADVLKIVPRFLNADNKTVSKIYYRADNTLMMNRECESPPWAAA
jgi:hypothetical protein